MDAVFDGARMLNTKFPNRMVNDFRKRGYHVTEKADDSGCFVTSPEVIEELNKKRQRLVNVQAIIEKVVKGNSETKLTEDQIVEASKWFLPYIEFPDSYLEKIIQECFKYDGDNLNGNFPLDDKEKRVLMEAIPSIVESSKNEIVVTSFGPGSSGLDFIETIEMLIAFCDKTKQDRDIKLIGYDVSEYNIFSTKVYLDKFISKLPEKWKNNISYEFYYGNFKDKKSRRIIADHISSDIVLWRHTWVACKDLGYLLNDQIDDFIKAVKTHSKSSSVLLLTEATRTRWITFDKAKSKTLVKDVEGEKMYSVFFKDIIKLVESKQMTTDKNNKPIKIIFDTELIKSYDQKGSIEYNAANPLIIAIREYCKSKGIQFDATNRLGVYNAINSSKETFKVIALTTEDKVVSDKFKWFRKKHHDVFVAGVRSTNITEEDNHILFMRLLTLTLYKAFDKEVLVGDMSSYFEDIGIERIFTEEGDDYYIFIQNAVSMEYEKFHGICTAQTSA